MSGKKSDRAPRPWRARTLIRGLWPDHNPLRRASDRLEAATVACLLVLFLIGAPLVGLFAWQWAAGAGARADQARQTPRYQVAAVLQADAAYQAYAWTETVVKARWTAPDGTLHVGQVDAPVGMHRGSTVTIWTDRAGHELPAPLRRDQVISQAVLAAVVAPLVLGIALISAGTLTRRLLDRQRLAAWAADWKATGPQWSRQR